MDKEKIEAGVKLILEGIGGALNEEVLDNTPKRVANMYEEIFSGIEQDPYKIIKTTFAENHDEMVLVKDIPLYSLCEHHLLPFLGKAHLAYIPGKEGRITGISKLARVVDVMAKKPQLQERLTTSIADIIEKTLKPRGVLVVIEAEHLCMSMRGVQKSGARTVTSAIKGTFRQNEATRAEAMSLINNNL